MMPSAGFQVLDTLRRREDEHHRDDGHCTKSLERERHSKFIFINGPSAPVEEDFHLPSHIRQDTAQFV
jgi:hypothetical protein